MVMVVLSSGAGRPGSLLMLKSVAMGVVKPRTRDVRLALARMHDATDIAALRNEVNRHLLASRGGTSELGQVTDRGVLWSMREGRVYVVRRAGKIIATLTLKTKKPWSIDRSFLTRVKRPIYLIEMAVAPAFQRRGIGRAALEAATAIAERWPGDSLVLDADDSPSGAGPFYTKCGFKELGRGTFRGHKLIYFERLLG